jgi:hypothetical protein
MMPFTAAKLGAVQGSAIVVNGLQAARWSAARGRCAGRNGERVHLLEYASGAIALQKPLPNELLRIVATGEKSDQAPVDE